MKDGQLPDGAPKDAKEIASMTPETQERVTAAPYAGVCTAQKGFAGTPGCATAQTARAVATAMPRIARGVRAEDRATS